MSDRRRWKTIGLGIFVILVWALYFIICSAPAGAPFIYANY
jgi:hypothetical protein